jgi:hypothetical protein
MTFKTFPYKLPCLLGFSVLGTLLWELTFRPSLVLVLFVILLFFMFIATAGGTMIWALFERTRTNLYRVLIYVLILTLVIPTVIFGNWLNRERFLFELPRYQQLTDQLLENATPKTRAVYIPPNYSDLVLYPSALVRHEASGGVSVWYLSGDSSAVGHSGYVYQSNDDLAALKHDHPEAGFSRIAPRWYLFGD